MMGRYPVQRHRLPGRDGQRPSSSLRETTEVKLGSPADLRPFVLTARSPSQEKENRKHTSQSLHDVIHGGLGFVPQQGVDGHHHPWGAETTLGAMSLGYSLLNTQPDATIQMSTFAGLSC